MLNGEECVGKARNESSSSWRSLQNRLSRPETLEYKSDEILDTTDDR